MTTREFLDKYFPPRNMNDAHQVVWDLHEDIEEMFGKDPLDFETTKGACHYKISTLLEICDKNIPDYGYLKSMLEDIEKL